MRASLLALMVVAAAASPSAAEDGAPVDCADAVAQLDMNQCAYKDYEAADAEMNKVWKKARATAQAADASQSDDLRGADKALIAAQRGWIAYRDGQCELAGFQMRGGSAEPMLVSSCQADLTRRRTRELQDFIDGP